MGDLVYKTTLKTMYGLTDGMIRQLGDPDRTVPNPHSRRQTSSLYNRQRVEEWIDAHKELIERSQASRERMAAAQHRRFDDKRQALVDWANTIAIVQTRPVPDKLLDVVFQDGQDWKNTRGDNWYPYTLSRNAVAAWLRHNLTNYETLLKSIDGQVGCGDAYMALRARVGDLVEQVMLQHADQLAAL